MDHFGFIPLDELQNIFTEAQRALDEIVYPNEGQPPRKVHMTEFLNNLKLRLIQRSRTNLKRYLETHPTVQVASVKAGISPDASRAAYEQRKAQARTWGNKG